VEYNNDVFAHLLLYLFIFKGTNFPDLGITVQPKKGRALLWPSILNAEPMIQDSRTRHQALPVQKGLKFGANAWVHMYVEVY